MANKKSGNIKVKVIAGIAITAVAATGIGLGVNAFQDAHAEPDNTVVQEQATQIEQLNQELTTTKTELETKKTELAKAESDLAAAQASNTENEATITELETEVAGLEADVQRLEAEVAELESQIAERDDSKVYLDQIVTTSDIGVVYDIGNNQKIFTTDGYLWSLNSDLSVEKIYDNYCGSLTDAPLEYTSNEVLVYGNSIQTGMLVINNETMEVGNFAGINDAYIQRAVLTNSGNVFIVGWGTLGEQYRNFAALINRETQNIQILQEFETGPWCDDDNGYCRISENGYVYIFDKTTENLVKLCDEQHMGTTVLLDQLCFVSNLDSNKLYYYDTDSHSVVESARVETTWFVYVNGSEHTSGGIQAYAGVSVQRLLQVVESEYEDSTFLGVSTTPEGSYIGITDTLTTDMTSLYFHFE